MNKKLNDLFVPYEQALALKKLGFNEPCFAVWNKPKEDWIITLVYSSGLLHEGYKNDINGLKVTAPLYQQAFRFFRDEYGLYFSIQYFQYDQYDEWCLDITKLKFKQVNYKSINGFKTYKEAELACLIKLIELENAKKKAPFKNMKNIHLIPTGRYDEGNNPNNQIKTMKNIHLIPTDKPSIGEKEAPKQETLKEAAQRLYPVNNNTGSMYMPSRHEINNSYKQEGFIKGYELAQERSYSEEEVLEIIKDWDIYLWNDNSFNGNDITLEQWFEKFKKK